MTSRPGRPCPICGSADTTGERTLQDHISGDVFHLAACRACGGRFIADPPAPEDLGRYYANPAGAKMHQRPGRLFTWMRGRRLDADLAPLLARTGRQARIVDLGAGDGSMARRLLQSGATVGAVDMYPPEAWGVTGVPYAQAAPGEGFAAGEISAPIGPPDAVIMRHVLEHVIDPGATLAAVADAGASHVMVIVPNVASPLARRFGEAWYYWDPPRHLTFFTVDTLARLAGGAGFRLDHVRTYGIDEVVTSAHRAAALRARRTGSERFGRLSEALSPTGLLAGVASAVAAPLGSTVIHAVLARDGRG